MVKTLKSIKVLSSSTSLDFSLLQLILDQDQGEDAAGASEVPVIQTGMQNGVQVSKRGLCW